VRQQAPDWLKVGRGAWAQVLESAGPRSGALITQKLKHWQKDPDLAGVRDGDDLVGPSAFEPLDVPVGRLPQLIYVKGPGAAAYRKPLTLGTANAVYIENCLANFGVGPVNRAGGN
jgi:hypothetical protein